jgi:tetratricopeptide (TPR) repeat protein
MVILPFCLVIGACIEGSTHDYVVNQTKIAKSDEECAQPSPRMHSFSNNRTTGQLTETKVQKPATPRRQLEQLNCYRLIEIREAEAQLSNGAYDSVIRNCTKITKRHPDCAYAYYFRAMAFSNLKKLDKAILDIEKATALYPENSSMWFIAGSMHENAGDSQKAVHDLSNEIALSRSVGVKGVGSSYLLRARNYIKLGQTDLALKDLDFYLADRRNSPEALYLHGLAKEQQGDFHAAERDYETSAHQLELYRDGKNDRIYNDDLLAIKRLQLKYRPSGKIPTYKSKWRREK